MEKIDIAKELKKNSGGYTHFIQKYIKSIVAIETAIKENGDYNQELLNFDRCLCYIQKENLDITNWELLDIPIVAYSYVFVNGKMKQAFDLEVHRDGTVVPCYLDTDTSVVDVASIQEAIDKYDSIIFT